MVVGATNRPDMLDPALIRSGRFDRLVLLEAPESGGRKQILSIQTRETPLAPDVSLRELAKLTEGYVGADLESIAREAAIEALREDSAAETVEMRHFRSAMEDVRPTITDDLMDYYERVQQEFLGGAEILARRELNRGFQ